MLVKTRLRVFSALFIALLLLVGGLGVWQLGKLRDTVGSVGAGAVANMDHANRLGALFADLRITSYRHVMELDVDRLLALENDAQKQQQQLAAGLKQAQARAGDGQRPLLVVFDRHWQRYLQLQQQVRLKSSSGEMQQALQLAAGAATVEAEAAARQLQRLLAQSRSAAQAQADRAAADYRRGLLVLGGALGAALLLGLAGSWLLARSLVEPLQRLAQLQHEVAASLDFTRRGESARSDEIGRTATSFDPLVDGMQRNLLEFSAAARSLGDAVQRMNRSAADNSRRAAQQSDAAAGMAAAVEQLAVSIQHIDNRAGDMLQLAQQTLQLSTDGQRLIDATAGNIATTAATVDAAAQQIGQLEQAAKHIESVVAVIKAVADETNLLALNAAIEAARAGEAGRGFAVVADAVRKLAERTAQSTGEIGHTVAAVKRGVENTVETMRELVVRVQQDSTRAGEGGAVIGRIRAAAEQTRLLVQEIGAAVSEENAASREFARQVETVAAAADANHAAASAGAGLARQVEQQALLIDGIVRRYRLA